MENSKLDKYDYKFDDVVLGNVDTHEEEEEDYRDTIISKKCDVLLNNRFNNNPNFKREITNIKILCNKNGSRVKSDIIRTSENVLITHGIIISPDIERFANYPVIRSKVNSTKHDSCRDFSLIFNQFNSS